MKIDLKKIIAAKRFIVLAASMTIVVIIGAVLVYMFTIKSAPDKKSSSTSPETRPSQVAVKSRQHRINKKITVITPVNVVDDAFKGYELNKGADADEQKAVQDKSPAEAVSDESAGQQPQVEKAVKQTPSEMKPERIKEKEANPRESTGNVSATSPDNSAGKNDEPKVKSTAQDEGTKLLNKRMVEAGLSEANKKKLIQSYLELRKVLPEKEAQKMIMWKIAHE